MYVCLKMCLKMWEAQEQPKMCFAKQNKRKGRHLCWQYGAVVLSRATTKVRCERHLKEVGNHKPWRMLWLSQERSWRLSVMTEKRDTAIPLYAVGTKVFLYGCVSELHRWSSFVEEIGTLKSTYTKTSKQETGRESSLVYEGVQCVTALLGVFGFLVFSGMPWWSGEAFAMFFQTNKALNRFSNYPGEFPLSLPTCVFNMILGSYFDPSDHLLQLALTKSWELSLVDMNVSYWCSRSLLLDVSGSFCEILSKGEEIPNQLCSREKENKIIKKYKNLQINNSADGLFFLLHSEGEDPTWLEEKNPN